MQTKTIGIVAVLAVLLAGAGAYAATSDEATTTTPYGCYGYGQTALTDEQQKAMLELRLKYLDGELTWDEMHDQMQALREELGITGPNFVDEDGDGFCDHAGQARERGYGRGPGGCGMGFGGSAMGRGGYGGMMGW